MNEKRFRDVKDRIFYRIMNTELNRVLLDTAPSIELPEFGMSKIATGVAIIAQAISGASHFMKAYLSKISSKNSLIFAQIFSIALPSN